jgi:hypothetical protein
MLKENSMIEKFIDDPTTYSGLWMYANGDDRHALYIALATDPLRSSAPTSHRGSLSSEKRPTRSNRQMLAAMINARSFRTCATIRIDFGYLQGD